MTDSVCVLFFFFFNDTATTEIYTLSLHDALPISLSLSAYARPSDRERAFEAGFDRCMAKPVDPDELINEGASLGGRDRKSTRLNSSHANISYAVFCLKKKNKNKESNA